MNQVILLSAAAILSLSLAACGSDRTVIVPVQTAAPANTIVVPTSSTTTTTRICPAGVTFC